MNSKFETYSSVLFSILAGKPGDTNFISSLLEKVTSPRYLIKGDVSGIQNFIFTIPSEKASRELKARSEYIKKYTEKWLNEVLKITSEYEILTRGGGNFYVFGRVNDEHLLINLEKKICKNSPEGIYLTLSWVKADNLQEVENIRIMLEKESSIKKMRKYYGMTEFFEPVNSAKPVMIHEKETFSTAGIPEWDDNLINKYSELKKKYKKDSDSETYDTDEKPEKGYIISFKFLADFAGFRTGTKKIAVLKMDVDNLGRLFSQLRDFGQIKKVSESLDYFFSEYLYNLLNEKISFKYAGEKLPDEFMLFFNNIYTVYSGGDDCFFVGAWDAILEFAHLIRERMRNFIREDELDVDVPRITLSASVQIYSPNYPVFRFAEEADENLHAAKYSAGGLKDKIYLMGEIFTWEEFAQIIDLKNKLYELIAFRNESRAILERIKMSGEKFSKDQADVIKGGYELPRTWRMHYSIARNIKPENREFAVKYILPVYESNLLRAYFEKKVLSAMIFPVSARYAELLTRNIK